MSYTPIVWSACGRPHRDTLTVLRSLNKSIARKRGCLPEASLQHHPGNLETQRPADSRMLAPRPFQTLWILTPSLSLLWFSGPWCAGVPLLLDRVVFKVCRLQPFCASRFVRGRSEQLRLLAVQLASLASLEDVVTNGLQSLLEAPSGLIAPVSAAERALPAALLRPRSRSRSPLPRAAPNRSRGFILLSQRGPLGCPSRVVLRPRLTARSPLTAAPAPRPPLLALSSLGARPARPASPPCPSLAPRLLILVRLRSVGLSRSPLWRR